MRTRGLSGFGLGGLEKWVQAAISGGAEMVPVPSFSDLGWGGPAEGISAGIPGEAGAEARRLRQFGPVFHWSAGGSPGRVATGAAGAAGFGWGWRGARPVGFGGVEGMADVGWAGMGVVWRSVRRWRRIASRW